MASIGIFITILITIYILHKIYARYCLTNLDIGVAISAPTATEGDILTLTEVLTNRKWLPLPWVSVKFRTGRELMFSTGMATTDALYRNDVFHILMHQKITRRLQFECTRRGHYSITGLELTAWDLLMEQKYIRPFNCNVQLTVYPATLPIPEVEYLCTRVYGQLRSRHPITPDPFTFRGIREYAYGDPMKAINFKASARGIGLMVNMADFSNAREVVIILDLQRHILWHYENLEERAIKIAASIAAHMNKIDTPTSLISNGKNKQTGYTPHIPHGLGNQHLARILEALAMVDNHNQEIAPISRTLESITLQGQHDQEYWLITPYHSKETEEAYLSLCATGARVVWIKPGDRPTDTSYHDDIIYV